MRANLTSFKSKMSRHRKKRIKKINCLARFSHYLFEICFPKELLCVVRERNFCVTISEIGAFGHFALVVLKRIYQLVSSNIFPKAVNFRDLMVSLHVSDFTPYACKNILFLTVIFYLPHTFPRSYHVQNINGPL